MPDALTPWINRLMPRLPGAMVSVARDELTFTISEFFREGLPWTELIGPFTVPAGTERFELNPVDAERLVIHVLKVYVDERPVAWRGDGNAGVVYFKRPPEAELVDAMTAFVALTPREPATWLPPLLTEQYFDAILDGALGRMFAHPQKPYSSTSLAGFHARRFRARTREARDMARRGYTPDAEVWSFPSFGV